jgi:drug/metabolite transporter (DMT)-like permease
LLGLIAGVVIGQAWRTDARAGHDRWWAALAVLSHGVVIAGFGFLANGGLDDRSNTANPTPLLALIPAALVALAFRRWLGGRIGWLVVFDVLIAATGLFGVWAWTSLRLGLGSGTPFEIGDVAVGIAVVASLVAMATAFRTIRPSQTDADTAAGAGPPDEVGVNPGEPDAAQPTT